MRWINWLCFCPALHLLIKMCNAQQTRIGDCKCREICHPTVVVVLISVLIIESDRHFLSAWVVILTACGLRIGRKSANMQIRFTPEQKSTFYSNWTSNLENLKLEKNNTLRQNQRRVDRIAVEKRKRIAIVAETEILNRNSDDRIVCRCLQNVRAVEVCPVVVRISRRRDLKVPQIGKMMIWGKKTGNNKRLKNETKHASR